MIYEKAKESVSLINKIAPYKISLPAEIQVTFQRTDYCEALCDKYERVDSRTLKKTINEITNYSSLTL